MVKTRQKFLLGVLVLLWFAFLQETAQKAQVFQAGDEWAYLLRWIGWGGTRNCSDLTSLIH